VTEARSPAAPPIGRRVLPLLALTALVLAAHGPVLANGFVWDDELVIVGNPDTRDLSALPRVLLSPDEMPPYYRPLNRASYLLDHAVFGMDPRGFHAVSLAIHLAGVLLLFAFARTLVRTPGPAFLAAALLAVHPVHTESVAFVAARNTLFALAFALAAVVLLARADRRGSTPAALALGVAFFLGLLSKEPAAMVLPFLAAWLLVPALSGLKERGRLSLLLPHLVALAVYLALRAVSLGGAASGPAAQHEELLSRLAVNWYTLPRYLALAVFPRDLTVFHRIDLGDPLVPWWLPLAWGGIVAVVGWCAFRRTPAALAGLLWLALHLAPVSNVIPIPSNTLGAERYFHLAAVGLWLIAADMAVWLHERMPRRLASAAAAALVLALGGRASARALDWRDNVALFGSAVRVDPGALLARRNLGVALKERGDLDGARGEWEEALRIDPSDAETLTHLGTLAAEQGDLAQAEGLLRAALRIAPSDAATLAQLGTLAAVRGDLARAEGLLRAALANDATLGTAHHNLARVLELTGRGREAVPHYEAVLRLAKPAEFALVPRARERVEALRAASYR
jgi:protein O-mannosyl-transferase